LIAEAGIAKEAQCGKRFRFEMHFTGVSGRPEHLYDIAVNTFEKMISLCLCGRSLTNLVVNHSYDNDYENWTLSVSKYKPRYLYDPFGVENGNSTYNWKSFFNDHTDRLDPAS